VVVAGNQVLHPAHRLAVFAGNSRMTRDIELYFRNIKGVAEITPKGHEGQLHIGIPVAVFFMATVMMHQEIYQVTFSVSHKLPVVLHKKGDFQKLAKFSV